MTTVSHAAYVVDASVAVRWFSLRQEPGREMAIAIQKRHVAQQCRLHVPEFFLFEVMSALRLQPRYTESDLMAALQALEDLHLTIHQMDRDIMRKTLAISWAYEATLYDAADVALAELVGYPLVTADEALVRQMRGHSIVLRLRDMEGR